MIQDDSRTNGGVSNLTLTGFSGLLVELRKLLDDEVGVDCWFPVALLRAEYDLVDSGVLIVCLVGVDDFGATALIGCVRGDLADWLRFFRLFASVRGEGMPRGDFFMTGSCGFIVF